MPKSPTKAQIVRNIKAWADKHGWIINPRVGAEYYAENFLRFNRCPCSKNRMECPCQESIEDVAKTGHCLCRLFWRDQETFDAQMNAPAEEGEEG